MPNNSISSKLNTDGMNEKKTCWFDADWIIHGHCLLHGVHTCFTILFSISARTQSLGTYRHKRSVPLFTIVTLDADGALIALVIGADGCSSISLPLSWTSISLTDSVSENTLISGANNGGVALNELVEGSQVYITLAFFRAGSSPMANRTLAPLR